MNTKLKLPLLLFFILFVQYATMPVRAPPFFGYKTQDGTKIQVYYTRTVSEYGHEFESPVFIPLWVETLQELEFTVYAEFTHLGDHDIELSMYDKETVTTYWEDDSGAVHKKNVTSYTQLTHHKVFQMANGRNPYADGDYGEVKIDKGFWEAMIVTSDQPKKKITVAYEEFNVSFYWLPAASIIPVDTTRGQQYSGDLMIVLLMGFVTLFGSAVFQFLFKRTKGRWFPADFTMIAAITGWVIIIFFLWSFMQGLSPDDLMRSAIVFPVELVAVLFAGILGLVIPSKYAQKSKKAYVEQWEFKKDFYGEMKELLSRRKNEVSGGVKPDIIELDVVTDRAGKHHYFKDASSLLEYIASIIWGPLEINSGGRKVFTVNLEDKQIMLVEKAEWKELPGKASVPKYLTFFPVTGYFAVAMLLAVAGTFLAFKEALLSIFLGAVLSGMYVLYIIIELARRERSKKLVVVPGVVDMLYAMMNSNAIKEMQGMTAGLAKTCGELEVKNTTMVARHHSIVTKVMALTTSKVMLFVSKTLFGLDSLSETASKKYTADPFIQMLEGKGDIDENYLKEYDIEDVDDDKNLPRGSFVDISQEGSSLQQKLGDAASSFKEKLTGDISESSSSRS